MTTVSVTEIKEKLARLLAQEENGEEIIITQGNRPVDIIQPIKPYHPTKGNDDALEIEELIPALG